MDLENKHRHGMLWAIILLLLGAYYWGWVLFVRKHGAIGSVSSRTKTFTVPARVEYRVFSILYAPVLYYFNDRLNLDRGTVD